MRVGEREMRGRKGGIKHLFRLVPSFIGAPRCNLNHLNEGNMTFEAGFLSYVRI